MRLSLAVLFCVFSTIAPAAAGPDRVSLLFGSYHADIQIEVEEINPGVFLEWEMERPQPLLRMLSPDKGRKPSTVAGVFRNSFGDGALSLAIALPLASQNSLELDALAGAAWYPGNGERVAVAVGDVVPLVGLRVSYRNAVLLGFPGDGESFDALFAFGVSFPLGGGH